MCLVESLFSHGWFGGLEIQNEEGTIVVLFFLYSFCSLRNGYAEIYPTKIERSDAKAKSGFINK